MFIPFAYNERDVAFAQEVFTLQEILNAHGDNLPFHLKFPKSRFQYFLFMNARRIAFKISDVNSLIFSLIEVVKKFVDAESN